MKSGQLSNGPSASFARFTGQSLFIALVGCAAIAFFTWTATAKASA
jgi:hypothetical protein